MCRAVARDTTATYDLSVETIATDTGDLTSISNDLAALGSEVASSETHTSHYTRPGARFEYESERRILEIYDGLYYCGYSIIGHPVAFITSYMVRKAQFTYVTDGTVDSMSDLLAPNVERDSVCPQPGSITSGTRSVGAA